VVLQKVNHQSQDVQDLTADLATLPQHLSSSLSHFLVQLQTIVTSENSSDARETLQEQLRQLIAALSSWNNQLKTELDLQQQLMDSLKRLDDKIDWTAERQNSMKPPILENCPDS
jgi:gas vesicle protein